MKWKFGSNKPDKPGWYAILILYDPREGAYAEGEYWNGCNWRNDCSFIVAHSKDHFESEDAAAKFAKDNNPTPR
ncbi:MAG: hypothetical protein AB7U29_15070 [Desulfobulbus sp.]